MKYYTLALGITFESISTFSHKKISEAAISLFHLFSIAPTTNGNQTEQDCGKEMKVAAAACVRPSTSV